MTPTPGDVHVNRPLTNISIAMIQKSSNFISSQVFPVVPSEQQSNIYYNFDNAAWNRDEMTLRAPAAESDGGGFDVDKTPTFFCPVRAFHFDIDDQLRSNNTVLDLDRQATEYVTLKALIRRERMFATSFMAGSLWTGDYDGVAGTPGTGEVLQWSDANSTPIEDVWAAKANMLERTGFEPNRLVLGYRTYIALTNHPDFIDRVKYGQVPGGVAMIEESDLQQLFKVERVLVMKAIYNTAKEGATKSHSFIGGGKNALLCYAAPAPGVMTPTAGYTFTWRGYLGAGAEGTRIKKFRVETKASDRVEIEGAWDQKLISADLGEYWDTVVA